MDFLHLKEKGHAFKDSKVYILNREDNWFSRGMKLAIFIKLERPLLYRVGAFNTICLSHIMLF